MVTSWLGKCHTFNHTLLVLLTSIRSTAQIKKMDLQIDLGAEEGRRSNAKSRFRVRIEPTKVVSFSMLQGFLAGQVAGSDAILETVSFLDHLLREGPSRQYTQIKKNFFVGHDQIMSCLFQTNTC